MKLSDINPSFHTCSSKDILPAGEYLVIDPCYVFGQDNELWKRFCDASFPNGSYEFHNKTFVMVVGKYKVVIFDTKYGDGNYPVYDNYGEHLVGHAGVDAGCLSFIPKGLIDELEFENYNEFRNCLGVFVTTNIDDVVRYDDGNARLDHIDVFTNDPSDEEDEEEDDLDEDE